MLHSALIDCSHSAPLVSHNYFEENAAVCENKINVSVSFQKYSTRILPGVRLRMDTKILLGTEAQLTWMQGTIIKNHLVYIPNEHPAITLGHSPSAPKWKGASALNAPSTSPIASTLELGVTMGPAAGHDLTRSARCSKSYYTVKQPPPQEAFQALSFKMI